MHLLFYKGTKKENPSSKLFDNLICLVTRSRFSHVELAVEQRGNYYKCWSSSARDGGVRSAWIDITSERWVVVNIKRETDRFDVENTLNRYKGDKYDYVGLISTLIKSDIFNSSDKWFCSEIISSVLGFGKSYTFSPEDLYNAFKK